jgi:hypothetical protein
MNTHRVEGTAHVCAQLEISCHGYVGDTVATFAWHMCGIIFFIPTSSSHNSDCTEVARVCVLRYGLHLRSLVIEGVWVPECLERHTASHFPL